MDRQRLVMVVVAAAASLVLLFSGRLNGDIPSQAARTVSSEPSGWIKVSGDVRLPGVYPIFVNNMADGVIALAVPMCDTTQATKARYMVSGAHLQVVCPDNGGQASIILTSMHVPERLVLNIPLDLNRATAGDLEALPGVGPMLAQRILQYRQKNGEFGRVEDLQMVDGIGEKRLKQLSIYLQVIKIKESP